MTNGSAQVFMLRYHAHCVYHEHQKRCQLTRKLLSSLIIKALWSWSYNWLAGFLAPFKTFARPLQHKDSYCWLQSSSSHIIKGNELCIPLHIGQSSFYCTCSLIHIPFQKWAHITGENPAAMQTGTSHRMQSTAPLLWVFLLLTATQYLLQRAHH